MNIFKKCILHCRIKKIEKALGIKLFPEVIEYAFNDKEVEFPERASGATTACALRFIFDDKQSNVISPSVLMYNRYWNYQHWNGKKKLTCIFGDASSHDRASWTVKYYCRIYKQLKSGGVKVRKIYFYG